MARHDHPRERGTGREAVLYARVSSKDQEREGFSIPAQQRLLHEYAHHHGITILREFIDVETAKATGRPGFDAMVAYLKRRRDYPPLILVEKVDRLYRNIKDWVIEYDLPLELHFVKDGVTISPDSNSTQKLMHGFRVLMAKNYVDNLSEEARKGMTEKARTGMWPSCAPTGYTNTQGPDGKRRIAPDPNTAPLVKLAFEQYSTGTWSIKRLANALRQQGLRTKKGNNLPTGTLARLLQNPLYTGQFTWNGEQYEGTYEPLITTSLYWRVQDVLKKRRETKERHVTREFSYTGLIHCATCGCLLVAERKKERYTYYHCTKNHGPCTSGWVREEIITAQLVSALGTLNFPPELLAWITQALRESHEDERHAHNTTLKRLQDEIDRLQRRLDQLYEDRLDNRITTSTYDEKARDTRARQHHLDDQLHDLQNANQDYLSTGITMLELTNTITERFTTLEPVEQRELLNLLIKHATMDGERMTVTFRPPFDALQTLITDLTTTTNTVKNDERAPHGAQQNQPKQTPPTAYARSEKWRGGRDSNSRPPA